MSARYDAVVVGGGHNGLAAGALLARAGRRVLVCEAREAPGGMAATEEIARGVRAPVCAHLVHALDAGVAAELGLSGHGLAYAAVDAGTLAVAPGGRRMRLAADPAVAAGELARTSPRDARRWQAFHSLLSRLAPALRPILESEPPRLMHTGWAEKLALLRLGLGVRRLGRADMREFLRIVGMPVADLLDDTFEDDLLKGALALDATLGANLAPRSPGTVFLLLSRWAGEAGGVRGALGVPRGGAGALGAALAAALKAAGGELRLNAPVAQVRVRQGRAQGVILAGGEEIGAGAVLAGVDPKRLFGTLVGPDHLDTGFLRRIRGLRTNGMAAKVNLVLDGLPDGLATPGTPARLVVAPSWRAVEQAFDEAKYGAAPAHPVLEATVPTLVDATLAPAGTHVVSVLAQYAPHRLAGEGWAARREPFADTVVAALDAAVPGLAARVTARQVLTPADIEARFGATGGHWHHHDLALDTAYLLRPIPGWARYRTPVDGLYLAGAGAHPGGGLTSLPGRNAARAVLADWRRGALPR